LRLFTRREFGIDKNLRYILRYFAGGVFMETVPANTMGQPGRVRVALSYVVSAIPVLMMLLSAVFKFFPSFVADGFAQLGWPVSISITLGIVELACAVLYILPRTSVVGAILVTGYLGGATATHVRVGDPSFFIPTLLGVLAWLGLWMRDRRIRDLIPLTEASYQK
jgi:hypothetical protein